MSYSLSGVIVDRTSKRVLARAELSFLKNINSRSYSCELDDVDPIDPLDEDFPDVVHYRTKDFQFMVSKDFLPRLLELGATSFKPSNPTDGYDAYVIDENLFNLNKAEIEEHQWEGNLADLLSCADEFKKSYVYLYVDKINDEDGRWYTAESFEPAKAHVKARLDEARKKLDSHMAIRDSKDYFEMSENGKNSLISEISWDEDAVTEYEWSLDSIERIISILEFYQDNIELPKLNDDNSEYPFTLQYEDNRSIAIYISVC